MNESEKKGRWNRWGGRKNGEGRREEERRLKTRGTNYNVRDERLDAQRKLRMKIAGSQWDVVAHCVRMVVGSNPTLVAT